MTLIIMLIKILLVAEAAVQWKHRSITKTKGPKDSMLASLGRPQK